MSVDGIYDTYLVCLEITATLLHHLRDAEQFRILIRQLTGDV